MRTTSATETPNARSPSTGAADAVASLTCPGCECCVEVRETHSGILYGVIPAVRPLHDGGATCSRVSPHGDMRCPGCATAMNVWAPSAPDRRSTGAAIEVWRVRADTGIPVRCSVSPTRGGEFAVRVIWNGTSYLDETYASEGEATLRAVALKQGLLRKGWSEVSRKQW